MTTLQDVIEIPELETDRQEAAAIAKNQEEDMPAAMRNGRSPAEIQHNLSGGLVSERDLVRAIDARYPDAGAVMSCLVNQHKRKINPGPDFLKTNVKSTDLIDHDATLESAFERNFGLWVRYGKNGLHRNTKNYALVFRLKGRAWVVGWATSDEVLSAKLLKKDSLVIPLTALRTPISYFETFR